MVQMSQSFDKTLINYWQRQISKRKKKKEAITSELSLAVNKKAEMFELQKCL